MKKLNSLLKIVSVLFIVSSISQIFGMEKNFNETEFWSMLFNNLELKNRTEEFDLQRAISAAKDPSIDWVAGYLIRKLIDGTYKLPVPSLAWQALLQGNYINKKDGKINLIANKEYKINYHDKPLYIKAVPERNAPGGSIILIQVPCWDQNYDWQKNKYWPKEEQWKWHNGKEFKTAMTQKWNEGWLPCGNHAFVNSGIFCDLPFFRLLTRDTGPELHLNEMQGVVRALNSPHAIINIAEKINSGGLWVGANQISAMKSSNAKSNSYKPWKEGKIYKNILTKAKDKWDFNLWEKTRKTGPAKNQRLVEEHETHPGIRFKERKVPEVFVANVGKHWIAVRVEYMPNGQIAVIFADSLGKNNGEFASAIKSRTKRLIDLAHDLLAGKRE